MRSSALLRIIIIVLACGSLLIGCGGGGSGSMKATDPRIPKTGSTQTGIISPKGSSITLAGATISFPEGAVINDTPVTVTSLYGEGIVAGIDVKLPTATDPLKQPAHLELPLPIGHYKPGTLLSVQSRAAGSVWNSELLADDEPLLAAVLERDGKPYASFKVMHFSAYGVGSISAALPATKDDFQTALSVSDGIFNEDGYCAKTLAEGGILISPIDIYFPDIYTPPPFYALSPYAAGLSDKTTRVKAYQAVFHELLIQSRVQVAEEQIKALSEWCGAKPIYDHVMLQNNTLGEVVRTQFWHDMSVSATQLDDYFKSTNPVYEYQFNPSLRISWSSRANLQNSLKEITSHADLIAALVDGEVVMTKDAFQLVMIEAISPSLIDAREQVIDKAIASARNLDPAISEGYQAAKQQMADERRNWTIALGNIINDNGHQHILTAVNLATSLANMGTLVLGPGAIFDVCEFIAEDFALPVTAMIKAYEIYNADIIQGHRYLVEAVCAFNLARQLFSDPASRIYDSEESFYHGQFRLYLYHFYADDQYSLYDSSWFRKIALTTLSWTQEEETAWLRYRLDNMKYIRDDLATPVLRKIGVPKVVVINQPPVISACTFSAQEISPDETMSMSITASDPEGQSLTYTWRCENETNLGVDIAGFTGNGSSVIWTAPTQTGSYHISCAVTDPGGAIAYSAGVVQVTKTEIIVQ